MQQAEASQLQSLFMEDTIHLFLQLSGCEVSAKNPNKLPASPWVLIALNSLT